MIVQCVELEMKLHSSHFLSPYSAFQKLEGSTLYMGYLLSSCYNRIKNHDGV